ncbi:MAG: hypothetical protein ACF8MF_10555 [Phycisphaerales bacterium JB052]
MTKHIIIAALVLIATTTTLILAWPESSNSDRWDEEAQQLTIERAQPIIQAIDAYRVDHADEPDSLNDLIPKYLDELPLPLVGGQAWEYHNTKRSYELTVPSSNPDPPSLLWMMIFGPSFDDRYFVYYQSQDTWGMADL